MKGALMTSSRIFTTIVFLLLIGAASASLVHSGVTILRQQQRISALGPILRNELEQIKSLYIQRADIVQKWLDEKRVTGEAKVEMTEAALTAPTLQEAAPAMDPAMDPAMAAATAAATQAATDPTPTAPPTAPAALDKDLASVKLALEETRTIELKSQDEFDRFERLQNEINDYLSVRLIEAVRREASERKSSRLAKQIREYEKLETDIADKRRDYHAAAVENNTLNEEINRLPFGLVRPRDPAPIFSAEAAIPPEKSSL
jgi:hypothetical protein